MSDTYSIQNTPSGNGRNSVMAAYRSVAPEARVRFPVTALSVLGIISDKIYKQKQTEDY